MQVIASPKLLLIAAPALVIPLLALLLFDAGLNQAPQLSPLEAAVMVLPMSGGQANPGSDPVASPFGRVDLRQASAAGMPLFTNSARAAAARLQAQDANIAPHRSDTDASITEFSLMHPRSSKEDFLVGHLSLAYITPVDGGMVSNVLQDFCNAQPGDAFYKTDISKTPLPASMRSALAQGAIVGELVNCGRLRN